MSTEPLHHFGGFGMGRDHLKPEMQSSSDATRRRCSSNFMEGMLSDPKRWNDAVQSYVQENFEGEDIAQQQS